MLLGPVLARMAVVIVAGLLLSGGGGQVQAPEQAATFAARVAALSEPGGYFDTDNLISNERGYLEVLPALEAAGVSGGAYIGVGPDQNFSYIAAVRPSIAVIVDIRRDNLLLHLLFKALFDLSETRVDYLALLCGRPTPSDLDEWRSASIDRIVAYMDATAPDAPDARAAAKMHLLTQADSYGVPLPAEDLATMSRFQDRFVAEGLSLQFNTTGRAPQWHYPTFRDLVLADDGTGRQANYLASEADFQFVKSLHARDLIIPVVGDLGGTKALPAVAQFLRARGEPLSAFYASNVEFYLWRDGSYGAFLDNEAAFPRADHAVIIRSIFGRDGSISEIAPVSTLTDLRVPAR
jgi:hypothetical protein